MLIFLRCSFSAEGCGGVILPSFGGLYSTNRANIVSFFCPAHKHTDKHRESIRQWGGGRPSCCQCHSCDHCPITMPKTKAQLRKKQNRDAKRQRVSFASLTPPRAGGTLSAPAPHVINTNQSNGAPFHQTSLLPSQGTHANLISSFHLLP